MTTPTPRTHLSAAEAAELRADLVHARAEARRLAQLLADARGRACTALCRDVARDRDRLSAARDRVITALDHLEADGHHEAAQRIRAVLTADAPAGAVPVTSHEMAELLAAALRPLEGTDWTPGSLLRAYREMSQAHEDSQADLGRALELIAELRDVAERADRAFARYDTGGGETPPDPGSVPRAQGVAVDGPETAVDGTTGVAGTPGMGADPNGAQNGVQAGETAESDTTEYHWGRAWAPTGDEATCPCSKAPCGYVIRTRQPSGCEIHGPTQTMRGGHPADRCPGAREG